MYVNLINIKKQSEKVDSKNQELEARLQQLNDLEVENSRLKSLLDFKNRITELSEIRKHD